MIPVKTSHRRWSKGVSSQGIWSSWASMRTLVSGEESAGSWALMVRVLVVEAQVASIVLRARRGERAGPGQLRLRAGDLCQLTDAALSSPVAELPVGLGRRHIDDRVDLVEGDLARTEGTDESGNVPRLRTDVRGATALSAPRGRCAPPTRDSVEVAPSSRNSWPRSTSPRATTMSPWAAVIRSKAS